MKIVLCDGHKIIHFMCAAQLAVVSVIYSYKTQT